MEHEFAANAVKKCSTPNGINARITHALLREEDAEDVCSTPNGINARITRLALHLAGPPQPVLNA